MSARDVVVTVPRRFGLDAWIAEGDAVGEPWSGTEWHFYLGGHPPVMLPGDRVYVVFNGAIRGYSPLVRIERNGRGSFALVRHGGAVAVTIPEEVRGFRGWRYRWWDRAAEIPFPEWRDPNATEAPRAVPERAGGVSPRRCRMSRRYVIADGARLSFGEQVASGGRVLGVLVGHVNARNAADALRAAHEQWPHIPLATLHATPEEDVDATE